MSDTGVNYALIVAIVSLLMNIGIIGALIFMVRNYAEKIALISHVVGHYLNELEQRETKEKLIKARRNSIAKVVNNSFLERSAR